MRCVVFLPCLLLACGRAAGPGASQPLRIAVVGELEKMSAGELSSASVLAQDWVFEPLLGVGDGAELRPKVARRFQRLDRSRYRLWLQDAKFSDGSPVSERDVRASLEPSQLDVQRDGDALVVSTRAPGARVDVPLVRTVIAKQSPKGPLGTGPFVVVQESPTQMKLRRSVHAVGRVDEVELLSYATPSEAFAHTLLGEADVLPLLPARLTEFFDGIENLQVVRSPSLRALGIAFNPARVSRDTRLALEAELPDSNVGSAAYREGCKPLRHEGAARVLPPGPRLSILTPRQEPVTERTILALRRWLGDRAGELEIPSAAAAHKRIFEGEFDLFVGTFLIQPVSMIAETLQTGSAGNFLHYSNAAADRAFDADDWAGAQRALAADPPRVLLCIPENIVVVDRRVKNPRLGPYGLLESLPDWEVGP